MKKIARIIVLTVAVCLGALSGKGQTAPYKFDLGASVGLSGYLGDANSTNMFRHPGFTADLRGAYLIDTRWQLRALLSINGMSGNTSEIANVLPADEQFSFSSQAIDLAVRGEFNFFSYGIGETYKRLKRWSPYLAVGVGVTLGLCDGSTVVAPSIPMAFGFRFKAKERLNLFAEFSMTKVFTDHLDGKELADLNHIKTDFYKSTDWFSRLTIGLTYEFGKRCETCHYVD